MTNAKKTSPPPKLGEDVLYNHPTFALHLPAKVVVTPQSRAAAQAAIDAHLEEHGEDGNLAPGLPFISSHIDEDRVHLTVFTPAANGQGGLEQLYNVEQGGGPGQWSWPSVENN
jgi:hypothetical protein